MKLVVPIMKEKGPELVEVKTSFSERMKFIEISHNGKRIKLTKETWDRIFKETKKMFGLVKYVMETYPVQKNESKILARIADYKGMEPKKLATELLSMAIMDEQRRLKEMGVL